MKYIHAALILLAVFINPVLSHAAEIPLAAGCVPPSASPLAKAYFVDPVNGNNLGDGSATRPWRTLSEVMGRPKPPVFATGDVINLMNGDHGSVLLKAVNQGFVTIMAMTGHSPSVKALNFSGASKWIVSGIKIQALNGERGGRSLVNFSNGANHILLKDNVISSKDDVSAWTQPDWVANAAVGINVDGRDGRNGTGCITIANNLFMHVHDAIRAFAPGTVVANNKITNFAGDGITFGADNIIISHNYISDNVDMGTGQHLDGMQGYKNGGGGYEDTVFDNVVIDSNTVIRQTDPNPKFPSYLQGISAFDYSWANLTVTNNIVITNSYQGLSFGSVIGGRIANNTVLSDGHIPPSGGTGDVWLRLNSTAKKGLPTKNVVLSNNIASVINLSQLDPSNVISNNLTKRMNMYENGKINYYSKPGVYGTSNVIVASLNDNFVNYNPQAYIFDLHLKPGSLAIGTGNASVAPAVDIMSTQRGTPADLGALVYKPAIQINAKLSVKASARQAGAPKLKVLVDGQLAGTQEIKADVHMGQVETYTYNLSLTGKPQKIELVLDGYGAQPVKAQSLNIFGLAYSTSGGKKADLYKVPSNVTAGRIDAVKSSRQFMTNGSTLQLDVTGLSQ